MTLLSTVAGQTKLWVPTWRRVLVLAVVCVSAFFLPQEVPLEYVGLDEPLTGAHRLELTCRTNKTSTCVLYLDFGRGFNERDTISFPVTPSERAYTYVFPLPDAALVGLRLDPVSGGDVQFLLEELRIATRANREVRRFGVAAVAATNALTSSAAGAGGLLLTATAGADDPSVSFTVVPAAIPEGMNERNRARCVRSMSYATLMLWLVLLLVWSAGGIASWRTALQTAAFLLFVAAAFSVVANRGLVRTSLAHAEIARMHAPKAR